MDTDTVITRSAHAVHRELEGAGGVVLDLETGAYFNLNAVGVAIWGAIEQPTTVDAIMAEVASRFTDVTPDLRNDVLGFLEELRARQLIEVGGERGEP